MHNQFFESWDSIPSRVDGRPFISRNVSLGSPNGAKIGLFDNDSLIPKIKPRVITLGGKWFLRLKNN